MANTRTSLAPRGLKSESTVSCWANKAFLCLYTVYSFSSSSSIFYRFLVRCIQRFDVADDDQSQRDAFVILLHVELSIAARRDWHVVNHCFYSYGVIQSRHGRAGGYTKCVRVVYVFAHRCTDTMHPFIVRRPFASLPV